MWRIATRLVFAAFLAQTGNACSDAPDPTASPEVPIFEGSIDLEIGEIDGDDPYLFTRIESIVEDASAQYASGLRIAHSGIGMVAPVSFDGPRAGLWTSGQSTAPTAAPSWHVSIGLPAMPWTPC